MLELDLGRLLTVLVLTSFSNSTYDDSNGFLINKVIAMLGSGFSLGRTGALADET